MSITGVSNNTAAWQTANRQKASASPQQPAATASSAVPSESSYDPFRNLSPTDSITVNLPSGLSIGYMHFGTPLDAAGEAQMADAAADLAGRFSGVTGNGATPTSDGTSAASGIPQDDGASDLLGGFECAAQRRHDGKRLDVQESTGHDRRATRVDL